MNVLTIRLIAKIVHTGYSPNGCGRYGADYVLKFEFIEKREALALRQEQAGTFVLLTSVPDQDQCGYSAEMILRTYKEQHGIEKNFGFLNDDQIVNKVKGSSLLLML